MSATLVKMLFSLIDSIAIGLESYDVPGATPKKPYSGLIALKVPSGPGRIQAMSSPTVSAFQPLKPSGGRIIARLVLPQALGKAAPM